MKEAKLEKENILSTDNRTCSRGKWARSYAVGRFIIAGVGKQMRVRGQE